MASTEGVMKATKEAPGAGEPGILEAAVLVVLGVDEGEGVSVPVALLAATEAPALGVVEGVGVPVGVGVAVGVGVSVPVAETPPAGAGV